MTNPIINPQPNYSGVTIQISNPAVNVGTTQGCIPQNNCQCSGYTTSPAINYYTQPENNFNYPQNPQYAGVNNPVVQNSTPKVQPGSIQNIERQGFTQQVQPNGVMTEGQYQPQPYPYAYPPQYYLNNYNYQTNGNGSPLEINGTNGSTDKSNQEVSQKNISPENAECVENSQQVNSFNPKTLHQYAGFAEQNKQNQEQDMTISQGIIDELNEREQKIQEEKNNTKEKRVVALTDEYIKSLENYLNNPNDEIRLMASKEILTRLDEDKDRYNDKALNALLNKMLQDPSKLIRISALSAFGSQLASGNDYTVKLLQNIQSNPSADKEDVLQAADILLKMSAGTEVKNIPNPAAKETNEQTKQNK